MMGGWMNGQLCVWVYVSVVLDVGSRMKFRECLNESVDVWINEWMDAIGPRSKCEIFCTLFWNCVPHILNWEFFMVDHGAFGSGRAFPSQLRDKDKSSNGPLLSHEITIWQQYTKWISTCKAVVHTVCVMKSMFESWEVNAFHCTSNSLSSHFLCPHHPVYQKYVCCYCVHTIPVTTTFNYIESPKVPLS